MPIRVRHTSWSTYRRPRYEADWLPQQLTRGLQAIVEKMPRTQRPMLESSRRPPRPVQRDTCQGCGNLSTWPLSCNPGRSYAAAEMRRAPQGRMLRSSSPRRRSRNSSKHPKPIAGLLRQVPRRPNRSAPQGLPGTASAGCRTPVLPLERCVGKGPKEQSQD